MSILWYVVIGVVAVGAILFAVKALKNRNEEGGEKSNEETPQTPATPTKQDEVVAPPSNEPTSNEGGSTDEQQGSPGI